MKKFKIIHIFTSCILASCILAGCNAPLNKTSSDSSKNSSDSGITLKVMTQRVDIVDTDLKEFADEYKNKTGINVEWVGVENYDDTMKVKIRANDDYGDVLMIPGLSKEEYPKYLEPLGKASDSDISPYRINKVSAIEENGDYTVYGLSYGLGAQGIVYNKAVFEKAGVNVDDMKTFDGFLEGCQKIKDTGVIPVDVNFCDTWTLGNWYSSAKCISGDKNFNNTLYKEDSIFDESKPLGQVFKLAGELVNRGFTEEDLLNTSWDQAKKDFAAGKASMMVLGTWIVPQEEALAENPDDIGFMPFPTKDGKTYTILNSDYAVAVSSKSKHKKEARDFVFAFNESDFAKNNGFIPNNQNLTEMDPVIKEFLNSGVTEIVEDPVSPEDKDKTSERLNKAGISLDTAIQKPMLYAVKSMEKFQMGIDDINEDWNNAKNS